ncbi:MAG: methanogenesis marker protein Mmp4/MtxX [Promethearchaeota archaeon]|jgi:putative methanogen marker protein 4
MTLVQQFKSMAKGKSLNIGIGLGISELHNQKILNASINFLKEYQSFIYLFGDKTAVNQIRKQLQSNMKSKIFFVDSQDSEQTIFEHLVGNNINAIIRGSLSSNKFLLNLKNYLKIDTINRLALLETFKGHQFFYGPVGIDECNTIEDKIEFLENAIKQFNFLKIKPKISILSGGRRGDLGRDVIIDESIKDADKTVSILKDRYPRLAIEHDEILIENAIEKESNLIIAPDGISGNLIYRTLVHLGGGKAYGAIYMATKNIIIDTSRVGDSSEIQGALLIALALS